MNSENITINEEEIKETTNKDNINYYKILHYNNPIIFKTTKVSAPFGIEENYGKYIYKLDCPNQNIIMMLEHLEKIVKDKYNIDDNNFKSIIRRKKDNRYNDIIICKFKSKNDKIIIKMQYENDTNNYLKSIYEITKDILFRCIIEVEGLWKYNNKYGLTLIIKKMIV